MLFQLIAKGNDVAACFHGDGNADGRLAVVVHGSVGRVSVAALHCGNIPQEEGSAVGTDRGAPYGVDVIKAAAVAQVYIVAAGFNHAGRGHLILGFQGVCQYGRADAQLRQLGTFDFHIDLFGLDTQKLHLLHLVDSGKAAPDALRLLAHFLHGVAVAGQGVDGAEYVIEAVVVVGAIDPGRQFTLQIPAEVADITPGIPDGRAVHVVPEGDIDIGGASPGGAVHLLDAGDVTELGFQLVCDLFLHLLGGGSRPGGGDNHLVDGEVGVLHAPKLEVEENAANGGNKNKIPD